MGNSKEGILHRLQRSKGFNKGGSKDSVTNYFPIGTRLVRCFTANLCLIISPCFKIVSHYKQSFFE